MSGQIVDPLLLFAEKSKSASFLLSSLAPSLPSTLVTLSNLVVKPPPTPATQATNVFTPSSCSAWLSLFLVSGLISALASVYGPVVTYLFLLTEFVVNASVESNNNIGFNLLSLEDEVGSS